MNFYKKTLLVSALGLICLFAQAGDIKRVISLSPGGTELIASAGGLDLLVGVVDYSDFPESVKSVPNIGSSQAINFERILLLKPDLIVTWPKGNRAQDIERLALLGKKMGFTLFKTQAVKLDEIPAEIEELGALFGTQATANKKANALRKTLKIVKQTYQSSPPVSFFYQVWNTPLITVGGHQFISNALNLCGATNSYKDMLLPAGQVTLESIMVRNPDLIILGGMKQNQASWKQDWQKWSNLDAVKYNRIITVDADKTQRPTARLINYLPSLCKQVDNLRP